MSNIQNQQRKRGCLDGTCQHHGATPQAPLGHSGTPGGVRREANVYGEPLPVGRVPARKHLKTRSNISHTNDRKRRQQSAARGRGVYQRTRIQNSSCARVATVVKPTKLPPTHSTGESLARRRPKCPQRAGEAPATIPLQGQHTLKGSRTCLLGCRHPDRSERSVSCGSRRT